MSVLTLTHGGGFVPSGQVTASTSTPHILISCFSVADRATVSGLGLNRSAFAPRKSTNGARAEFIHPGLGWAGLTCEENECKVSAFFQQDGWMDGSMDRWIDVFLGFVGLFLVLSMQQG